MTDIITARGGYIVNLIGIQEDGLIIGSFTGENPLIPERTFIPDESDKRTYFTIDDIKLLERWTDFNPDLNGARLKRELEILSQLPLIKGKLNE